MQSDSIIQVQNVNKQFKLPHEKHSSIKSLFVNIFSRKRSYEIQNVLKDISFEVKQGEFFGIIGRNGSGKSTMLKLLAGIYAADEGKVRVNGRLTPFIELGVGFNPELTGRENVYLNGALLGFNRSEIDKMYKQIVEFAELEKFMDQKLKNYSSGMQVRLAFSIAIRANSDILLLDEVLAVGDISFQEKCYKYFNQLKKNKNTVVFISHDSSAIEKFCDRVAIIDKGKLVDIGDSREMVLKYGAIMAGDQIKNTKDKSGEPKHQGNGSINIKSAQIFDKDKKSRSSVNEGEPFTVKVEYSVKRSVEGIVVAGVDLIDDQGISILSPNSAETKQGLRINKDGAVSVEFAVNPLAAGTYNITVGMFNERATLAYDLVENIAQFKVIGERRHGKVYIEPKWTIIENKR